MSKITATCYNSNSFFLQYVKFVVHAKFRAHGSKHRTVFREHGFEASSFLRLNNFVLSISLLDILVLSLAEFLFIDNKGST